MTSMCSRARLATIGLIACAALQTACSAGARPTPQSQAEAIRREATPARLEASGDASGQVGDMTRAEQYYVAAMSLGGVDRRLTQKLIAVCAADERYPVAVRYASEYLARHPDDTEMRFAAASLQAAMGDAASARAAYERVVTEQPSLAEAHYALGMLLREQRTGVAESATHLRAYLQLQPRGRYAESARAALARRDP
jgi:tetratricopeptide (TPR) repeat protein